MAKTPENVYKFLDDLKAKLTPLAHEELKTLLEYKKREVPDADKINAWDLEYYKAQWLKEKYNVDHDLIRKYFPMEYTVDKVFELFGEEFDLTFEKVTSNYPSWLPAADSNVDLIKVSDRTNKDIIGYFYIDLFPRDGKFTHAALFPLQFGSPSTQWANNQSQPSVGAMVCNFPKPTASKPSLLKHNDVVTFCHELGHVLHHICSKTHYSRFHGTNVEHDFVETPSQLMENWCWERSVLKRLSKHHETGEPLPDDVIDCLIGSKNAAAGLFWLRQLLFCYFDMEIHTKPDLKNLDTTALYDKIRQEVALVPNQTGTYQHATIGHFMGGYDAGYYGYLWSLVYATDIYYTIFKGSELGKGGRNFRENVLLKGGSIDSMELLKKALSREPSSTPFLKSLGIL
jgi:Zn-dependent oligopeptidase